MDRKFSIFQISNVVAARLFGNWTNEDYEEYRKCLVIEKARLKDAFRLLVLDCREWRLGDADFLSNATSDRTREKSRDSQIEYIIYLNSDSFIEEMVRNIAERENTVIDKNIFFLRSRDKMLELIESKIDATPEELDLLKSFLVY